MKLLKLKQGFWKKMGSKKLEHKYDCNFILKEVHILSSALKLWVEYNLSWLSPPCLLLQVPWKAVSLAC